MIAKAGRLLKMTRELICVMNDEELTKLAVLLYRVASRLEKEQPED